MLTCTSGSKHTLVGANAPITTGLLITFGTRTVGGGVSDSAGRYSLALNVGDERPGIYLVTVQVRGGKVLATWRCDVPGAAESTGSTVEPTRSTASPVRSPTPRGVPTTTPRPTINPDPAICDPSYPDFCIPPPPPQLSCDDVEGTNFRVLGNDPHNFDGNNNGIGCEA